MKLTIVSDTTIQPLLFVLVYHTTPITNASRVSTSLPFILPPLLYLMNYNVHCARALLHKNQKTLYVTIKIENAAIAKQSRISKFPPKLTSQTVCIVVDTVLVTGVTIKTTVAINSSPLSVRNLIVIIRLHYTKIEFVVLPGSFIL